MTDNPIRPNQPPTPKPDPGERDSPKRRRSNQPRVRRSRWVHGDDAGQSGIGAFNRVPAGRPPRRSLWLV